MTVYLKHNERLSFIDLPTGAPFIVEESAVVDYTASYSLVVNGGLPVEVDNGVGNKSLSIPLSYLGEAENSVAFDNAYKEVIITGISVDNLPYIVLIAIAALALVGYVVIRTRRNADQEA
jgi:hypothetical protein